MLEGKLITYVKSIKIVDGKVNYAFPKNAQHESYHTELFQLSIVKNASKCMTREGQFRNVSVLLSNGVEKLYTDEQGNFVFRSYYLDEVEEFDNKEALSINKEIVEQSEMMKLCMELKSQLAAKEISLMDVERKFVSDKFNGKQNAKEWLEQFNKECERFNITNENKKIQCLRLFLEDNAKEWFSSNWRKLPLDSWAEWSESFLKVYADKNWSKVRFALNFKYFNGSLMDYALKKERLLLEVEKSMSTTSRINLIVVGLPLYIQDKLDRDEILNTDLLMNKLRLYESGPNKQKREEKFKDNSAFPSGKSNTEKYNNTKKTFSEKKPCFMCESLNKPDRYHPLQVCRNRQKFLEMKKVNLAEVNQTEIDELMRIELDHQKN